MHKDIKKILICLTAIVTVIAATATTALAAPPDFKALRDQNKDIYAWLYIPGTDINYPVCQSNNDAYYLSHNTQGRLDANGALYTESAYNGKGFTDPVTVIYGHNMRSGRMFGYLEETFREGFEGHEEAIVYMPGGTYRYELFAAMPISNAHLLYGRNYYKKSLYQQLIDEILHARVMEAVRRDTTLTVKDKLLVLSTCRGGGKKNERYIVVGKLKK